MSMRKEILKVLDAAIAPAKTPTAPPDAAQTAFIAANWGLVRLLAAEDKPRLEKARKALAPLVAKYNKIELGGMSHADAMREHRKQVSEFAHGKSDVVPKSKQEFIDENARVRRAFRSRQLVISQQAAPIAADYWESLIELIPAFREKLATQEKLIFSQVDALGKSPLMRMVDDLPRFLKGHAAKLRLPGARRDPSKLLPED